MGSPSVQYSVPGESQKCLLKGILQHKGHRNLPKERYGYAEQLHGQKPKIAIDWRLAESVAALKGFEAVLLNLLLVRKYGCHAFPVTVDTDHAQLFLMSFFLLEISPSSKNSPVRPTELRELNNAHSRYFPSCDLHHQTSSQYRKAVTNMYQTGDLRYYHLHASLNPDQSLKALDLPWDVPEMTTIDSSWAPFKNKMSERTAEDWEKNLAGEYKQAGTTCYAPEEYDDTSPAWWPNVPATGIRRPLAGLKIVDLTRIVAGPSIGRTLAELGANVMRVTGAHIADFSGLHPDLNRGKWTCHLDLPSEHDQAKFRDLMWEADVVINGYRPYALDKSGAGYQAVSEMGKRRGRGYIYVRENCLGWTDGTWSNRPGWQPISDACTGVSMGFGRAMGLTDEPVTPVLPDSDYCTGIAGACGVLEALVMRAEKGGSILVSVAISYYNKWLVDYVGEYNSDVWVEVWSRNGRQVFRHFHSMNYTAPHYMKMFQNEALLNLDFFEIRGSKALGGVKPRVPRPVLHFLEATVEPGYIVRTRSNGVDQAKWPADLDDRGCDMTLGRTDIFVDINKNIEWLKSMPIL